MKRQPWLTVVSLLLVAVGCSNPVDTESEQAVLLQLDREKPDLVMRVRFKSDLTLDQVKEIAEKRAPEFEALAGLRQKYYLQDVVSGEFAGLYIWDSADALAEYRESELRATIGKAYQTKGEPHIEVYKIFKVLRGENR
jgi:heme-degrading monooxygenase HmoA